METAEIVPVSVYTEMTPNPETMKFVTNKILLLDNYVEFKDIESATDSPLAIELFAFPFVKGVFFMNNFVTVTKDTSADWMEISIPIKDFLKNYFDDGKAVFSTNFKLEKPVEEKKYFYIRK